MLRALWIFVLVSLSSAQYNSRCGLDSEVGTTLKKTEDDIDGRYIVEWCSKLQDEATEWTLKLYYIDFHNGTKTCPKVESGSASISLDRYLTIHSVFTEKLKRPFLDCNITCLSKPLDLLFSGCYLARSQLSRQVYKRRTWQIIADVLRVDNRFQSAEDINRIQPFYVVENEGKTLIVTWNLHYIPVLNYSMEIAHYQNRSATELVHIGSWKAIQDNCTHDMYSVVCQYPAPQPGHCVASSLIHNAPWRGGNLFHDANIMKYCSPIVVPESVEVRLDSRVWWAVAALAVVLAALAACWCAHSRLLAALRKRVLRHWTHRYSQYASESGAAEDPGYILLLYARDCAPAMEAVAILKDMLEDGAPGRVYDIFAPECMSLYAASPPSWLRGVLARPDVRVLLVQSPAAAALYGAQQDEDSLHLQEPLLGSRVQYRRPHYGDALLQLALRLVRDMAHMQHEYTKYYIATFAELQADMLPQVAAYRRYVLPAHAPLLLSDLRLRIHPHLARRRLDQLAPTVHKLQDYIRDNENYLRDELMFL